MFTLKPGPNKIAVTSELPTQDILRKHVNSNRPLSFRSRFESRIAKSFRDLKIPFLFERVMIIFPRSVSNGGLFPPAPVPRGHSVCQWCRYWPDFVLLNGVIIETKGKFIARDRMKHRIIKELYPKLDIRLLFYNSNQVIPGKKKESYSVWADRHKIPWANQKIPRSWLR